MRLYLDASVIIYSLEGEAPVKAAVLNRLRDVEAVGGRFVTSLLARLEVRVVPVRTGETELLARYDRFLSRQVLQVMPVDETIIERATDLRARYSFRSPDAIHLATAIEHRADRVLTGDRRLVRCTEIPIDLIDPATGEIN